MIQQVLPSGAAGQLAQEAGSVLERCHCYGSSFCRRELASTQSRAKHSEACPSTTLPAGGALQILNRWGESTSAVFLEQNKMED